jgi:hypothetical protein
MIGRVLCAIGFHRWVIDLRVWAENQNARHISPIVCQRCGANRLKQPAHAAEKGE